MTIERRTLMPVLAEGIKQNHILECVRAGNVCHGPSSYRSYISRLYALGYHVAADYMKEANARSQFYPETISRLYLDWSHDPLLYTKNMNIVLDGGRNTIYDLGTVSNSYLRSNFYTSSIDGIFEDCMFEVNLTNCHRFDYENVILDNASIYVYSEANQHFDIGALVYELSITTPGISRIIFPTTVCTDMDSLNKAIEELDSMFSCIQFVILECN